METKRTNILVLLDRADPVFLSRLRAYGQRQRLDWQLTTLTLGKDGVLPPHLDVEVQQCAARIALVPESHLPTGLGRGPLVVLGNESGPGKAAFQYDHAEVGRVAARHFAEQGLPAVATVRPWRAGPVAVRYTAFAEQAQRLGLLVFRYEPPAESDDMDMRDRERQLARWLSQLPQPLGVFLHQDRPAEFFLRFCQRHGFAVPEQLAVLGVDNRPTSSNTEPPLSSIDLPSAWLGEAMALAMHRLLSGASPETVHHFAPGRVVQRASTTAVACADARLEQARQLWSTDLRLPVAEVAARVGVSPVHLRRLFHQYYHQTPNTYRRSCRLRRAQELLDSGEASPSAIAKRCGLGSAAALWQLFKNAGLPAPSRWRG